MFYPVIRFTCMLLPDKYNACVIVIYDIRNQLVTENKKNLCAIN